MPNINFAMLKICKSRFNRLTIDKNYNIIKIGVACEAQRNDSSEVIK